MKAVINRELEKLARPLSKLIPDPENSRDHSLRNIAADLDKLGWKDYELQPLFSADWSPPNVTGEVFDADDKGEPVKVTKAQRITIERAVKAMRTEVSEPDMSEGRAVELVCADYLAGAEEPDDS